MADETLAALLSDFLAEEVEEHPVRATQLGIDGHDDRLGEYGAEDFERRAANAAAWLDRFDAVAPDGLSLDDGIDRDLVRSKLRGRGVMADWANWRRDPSTYLQPCMSGVFTLFLHRALPEPELARCAASRLREVPGVLAAARDNLEGELANPLIVTRALGSCRAGINYFRTMVPAEVADPDARAEVAAAGEVAAGALEGFQAHLEELAATATGDWGIGEDRYSAILQEEELLGYNASAMRERGRAAYDTVSAEMAELATRIGGSPDWRGTIEGLNADHPDTPEAMRDAYEDWTEKARAFLHETGIVTMPPGEECRVSPSPVFQRPMLAVASYSSPPAFRPSLTGTFFVPFPPDRTSAEEVQQRLSTNAFHTIPTVAVHEAYPGHHWHLVTMQANPRPIRRVLGTSYFSEGWALYAEALMREHGFFADPRQELCHLDARLFRAARIIVDTSLHMGEMSVEEAVEFMSTKSTLSEATARAEVGRYCAWPTQASSYLTGCLEIERIRARYFAEGRGDVRQFNDTIAGSGMLPIELAERAVLSR